MLYFLENLLKLPKVSIQNIVQESEDIFLILECTEDKVKCKDCQNLTDELHQTRYVMVRDLPISGQSVYLKVPRRKFYCKHCQHYFTEDLEFMKPRRKYTERYEKYIYQRVKASSIEQVKREESLSWSQVDGIHKHQCEELKKTWNEVKRVGMDEIAKRKGHKDYATV